MTASSLLARLSTLADKTPDEIVKALTNPWKVLGNMSEAEYNELRDRRVLLYNRETRYYIGDQRDFDLAERYPIHYWSKSVFVRARANTGRWRWAFAEEAVPYNEALHHVEPD